MDITIVEKLVEYLKKFISEPRLERIEEILAQRTNHLTIVLEDLHKAHNANAVLRSADGFGLQDVYVIEEQNTFDTEGTVSIGAHQWLTLNRYNEPETDNTTTCFKELRKKGYKIVATTPHEQDSTVEELDVSEKLAIVFGGELEGISDKVKEEADAFIKIPMFGFSESFNISVSAAIVMYELTKKLRASDIDLRLEEEYQTRLKHQWIKRTIKAGEQLEKKFLSEQNK